MITQHVFTLRPRARGFHIITREIESQLSDLSGRLTGIAHIFIMHTSAGLTLNENADPDVRTDFETIFSQLVPESNPDFVHTVEGPDDMPAHAKSSLVGAGLTVPIRQGRLLLGTWQGVYLCEFRNRAGGRRIAVTVVGEETG